MQDDNNEDIGVAVDQDSISSDAITRNSRTRYTLKFGGKAGEYFGIWIVNILLSIATLGIYSVWAKVRTRRYFYGHTRLAGYSFDYLATPISILKGRIIAVIFFGVYAMSEYFSPGMATILAVVIWLSIPWLIVRGRIFNAYNTAYRNIRFNFTGRVQEAVYIYILLPIFTGLTFGILYPYMAYRAKCYFVDNHGFGKSRFVFIKKDSGYFYTTYLLAGFLFVSLLFVMATLFSFPVERFWAILDPDVNGLRSISTDEWNLIKIIAVLYFSLFIAGSTASIFIQTRITNHVWSNTRLGDTNFSSTLKFSRMLWIYFTNIIAIIASFGFAIPWAKIRMWRYRTENFHLFNAGDLDSFLNDQADDVSAVGEELGEVFDVDMGF